MNPSFWKNKKVFLTGHTGFKGAWMSIWLDMLGAKVKGYALKPDHPSLYEDVYRRFQHHHSVIADIRNKKKLRKELLAFQPDVVFHFAAQALVRDSYTLPAETFEINAVGTANLLDAIRFQKKECLVVVVTTDKVYENSETGKPYSENDRLGGHDPYSASKAAAEIVTQSFRLSFFHPLQYKEHRKCVASARAGNVIGGGDYAKDRIIPDIFRALSKLKTVPVRNPNAIRPWQHVLEPLGGYLTLAEKMHRYPGKLASSFNFGPRLSDSLKVEDLVQLAIRSWGKGNYKVAALKKAPHEAGLLRLSIKKANRILQWAPKWDAEKGIGRTINWYRDSMRPGIDKFDLCLRDIRDYTQL